MRFENDTGLFSGANVKGLVRGRPFGIVSVTEYGRGLAVDGTDDWTAAIQRALDSLSEGSVLVFPPGRYLVASNLSVSDVDRLTIIGYGATIYEDGASLTGVFSFTSCDWLTIEGLTFEATEDTAYFQANTPSEERSFLALTTCDSATIKAVSGANKRRLATLLLCDGLVIDGYQFSGFMQNVSEGAVVDANHAPCIAIRGCNFVSIANGRVNNHGSAVLSQLTSRNVSIRGVVGHDLHDNGVYISSGQNVSISACSMHNVVSDGIKGRGWNICVTGCSIEAAGVGVGLTGAGSVVDSFNANGYNLVAIGNVTLDCGRGVYVRDAEGFYPRNVVVAGNTVLGATDTGAVGAIEMLGNVGDYVCNNNTVATVAGDMGIVIAGQNGTLSRVTCCGNVVSDVNGSAANTRGGIRVNAAAQVSICNNVFSDVASGVGVRLLTVDGGVVSGNQYEGNQVVRCPTGETNVNVTIAGNRGATITVDGDNNTILQNDAEVSGLPSVATTPRQAMLFTVDSGVLYGSVGSAASTDWKALH